MSSHGTGQALKQPKPHKLIPVSAQQAEQDAKSAVFVYTKTDLESANAAQPRPELAGLRLRIPQRPEIYLVDPEGFRHWVPDPYTYNRLFRDWSGVHDDPDLLEIADAGSLSHGATLIRADGTAPVYFVSTGTKRWVVNPAVMDKCNFNWPAGGDVVAPAVTDAIRNGLPWNVP